MLDAEFSKKVMDSSVLSQSVKRTLIESMSNLDGDTRTAVCELIRSMEQAVGEAAEEFLTVHQSGNIEKLLQK
ncbi:MAG: hypothetical protein KBB51_02410 [Candidatus Moranbacteria bacterium]|nr:hypothetical protein [Candidatus Moranbacteria bacterium]